MKSKIIILLSLGVFFWANSETLLAQSQEQIDKINEERKTYFTEKLELTESESKTFWPLYNDFQNRKMKLVEDERNTWSYAHKNAENLSDKEILETLNKGYNLKEEQLKLEREYYQDKFLKALPTKKVLKLGKVEWDFRRYLLRQLREDGNGRRSQGGGSSKRPGGEESFEGSEPGPANPAPSCL